MSVSAIVDRLAKPLCWTIAAVFTVGTMGAVAIGPAGPDLDATRAGADAVADPAAAPTSVPVADPAPAGTTAEPVPTPVSTEPQPAAPSALGTASVPAAGVHRYEVTTTQADGTTTVQEERREIEVLSGDRTSGTVRISARLGGESQVSVLDWSPSAAVVRSTRIESTTGTSQACTWDPPFPELGMLSAGERWTLDSSCQTSVAGVDTRLSITGEGSVVGPATVTHAGDDLRVWQIHRDRTTRIEARVAGETLVQTAREEGDLFLDPTRGLVIRSDVTITLGGAQTGMTRRVSVLQPG